MNELKVKEITDVVSLRTLQKIQDSFSTALEIPLSIRNLEGKLLTRISNESKLWNLIKTNPATDGTLKTILKEAFQKSLRTGQVIIFERYIDTKAFAAPININGKTLGFFVGGLVRFGNPNLETCLKEADKLGIDQDEYLEAYLELSLFTPERLQAAATLIKIISNTISTLEFKGNEIKIKTEKIQQKNEELAKNLEKASDALNKNKERLQKLFHAVNDGIYIADIEGRLLEINSAGAKMLGFEKPSEIIGQLIKNFYINSKNYEEFIQILNKNDHIENFMAEIKTKDGQNKYYEVNAILVKNNKGNPVTIQGIFRDTNERRFHLGIKN